MVDRNADEDLVEWPAPAQRHRLGHHLRVSGPERRPARAVDLPLQWLDLFHRIAQVVECLQALLRPGVQRAHERTGRLDRRAVSSEVLCSDIGLQVHDRGRLRVLALSGVKPDRDHQRAPDQFLGVRQACRRRGQNVRTLVLHQRTKVGSHVDAR
ncbi:MAG: hypothetical protein M3R21_04415 [Candidatus Dormibacteraeota bacterium]|nr:hypothetical protein [Candidatus Dormibacteraeota bacterium]